MNETTTAAMKCLLFFAAVSCLLSGCCNESDYREAAKECVKKGGTFCFTCEASSPFFATVSVSCKGILEPKQ